MRMSPLGVENRPSDGVRRLVKPASLMSYRPAHVCGRTLPKSSRIDAVASGDAGNADLVIKRRRRAYKGMEIPLGKTLSHVGCLGDFRCCKTTAVNGASPELSCML